MPETGPEIPLDHPINEEVVDLDIDSVIRNYAQSINSHDIHDRERRRLQREFGVRAIPSIIQNVSDQRLDAYEASVFLWGTEGDNEILYKAFKDLAFLRPTYADSDDWSALSRAIEGMCATSANAQTFSTDIDELARVVRNTDYANNRQIQRLILSKIEALKTNYLRKRDQIREEMAQERNDRVLENADHYFGLDRPTINPTPPKEYKPENLVGITKQTVGKILTESTNKETKYNNKDSEFEESVYEISSQDAIRLAETFYELLAGSDKAQFFPLNESEQAFLESVRAEFANIPEDIDTRIIRSQISSLHALIFSGGLDALFRNYLAERIKRNKNYPQSEVDILKIKTDLAYDFLQRVEQKNQEKKMTDLESGAISVGMEIEFKSRLADEVKTREIYENLLTEYKNEFEQTQEPHKKAVYEREIKFVERKLELIDNISKNTPGRIQNAINVWEPGAEVSYKLAIINKQELSEKDTRPAASYRTQLRELVAAASIGGLRDRWNIHETFGGIKLTSDHTEFMDALPITAAADFIQFDKVEESLKNNLDVDEGVYLEIYHKQALAGGLIYFPFHKPRGEDELKDFEGKVKTNAGIELRSLPDYTPRGFIKLVRQLSFNHLYAHSVKSVQKDENARTPQDKELVKAYQTLMGDWKKLLSTKNIKMPKKENYYINGLDVEEGEQSNGYVVFLGRMIVLSQDDPEFSQKTRELVTKFNKTVKNVLGINSRKT